MRKSTIVSLSICALLVGALESCSSKKETPETNNEPNASCNADNATYLANVRPLLNQYCVSCHGNSSSVRLSTYEQVKAVASSGRLVGSIKRLPGYRAMPEGKSLSTCEISTIENWVNNGALNN